MKNKEQSLEVDFGEKKPNPKSVNINLQALSLIHELGHSADAEFGDDASKLRNDGDSLNEKENEANQKYNRGKLEKCKNYIKKLGNK